MHRPQLPRFELTNLIEVDVNYDATEPRVPSG